MAAINSIKMSLLFAVSAFLIFNGISHAHPLIEAPAKIAKYLYKPDPLQAAASEEIPMVHNNNYDMIMMAEDDDQHTQESMQYQNFDTFYDPQSVGSSEYNMDESQFLMKSTPVREPQPLSAEERRIRQSFEGVDSTKERKKQLKLKKGSSVPRGSDAAQWEQFDYDSYSSDPVKGSKKSHY